MGLVFFLLFFGILLSIPSVQTKIGTYITNLLHEDFGASIKVEQVAISIFGGVKLKKVLIKDHKKDTLIYASRIKTDILSLERLKVGDLIFGDIRIDSLYFNLKTYKNENRSNINIFTALFDSGKPSTQKFILNAQNVYVSNSHFILSDENNKSPKTLDIKDFNMSLNAFKIIGSDVYAKINKLAAVYNNGLIITNLETYFAYTSRYISLKNLKLETEKSFVKGDLIMKYKDKDFDDFNNKVQFDFNIDNAKLATNDLKYFYDELGKNKIINVKTIISGTLNNLFLKDLILTEDKKTKIAGDLNLKNSFGNQSKQFYLKGSFSKINTNYENLVTLLPNILTKSLPVAIKKLGQFDYKGKVEATSNSVASNFLLTTAIGDLKSNVILTGIENINTAKYKGEIELNNFDIGKLLDEKMLNKTTLNLSIEGSGFTKKNLNCIAKGNIVSVDFKNYNYKNIRIDGNIKAPLFNGKININDPNLILDFEGLVDLSKKERRYNFKTKIDYANLSNLKIINDTISIFRGEIKIDVAGNSIENLYGKINIDNTAYQNNKDKFIFDNFFLESTFDTDRVRTITINSPDIIEGKVVGKFQFSQVQKMLENAVGSLYANYAPNKLKKGQFLKFNFSIYNKIIEIFYPGIKVGANTIVKGNINSDNDEFKLNFNSPSIKAFDNYFKTIKVDINNKNPLYNAFIEVDTIKTKYYKFSDFSLVNVTAKDTLYVRSEFKGGDKAKDFFNMNLFYTIDKDRNNIIGIKKSDVKFKDYFWFLNEKEATDNRIIFDKRFRNFRFDNIILTHEQQKVLFSGDIKEKDFKDLSLTFNDVNINKILPTIDGTDFYGNLNGIVNFKQNGLIFQPTSSLTVEGLKINDIGFGNLKLDIEGDNGFKKFNLNASLTNKNLETFLVDGNFKIENKKTILELDLRFNKFNLAAISSLGGTVISNIRGLVSGNANIAGALNDPNIYGRLFLDGAGLKIPYLNTDFNFSENSIIDLSDDQFIFQNNTLTDTKYKTEANLNGTIKHKLFSNWKLDLSLSGARFLALDTEYSDEASYYGKAFIEGKATIIGPTNALVINVVATSKKGTIIKIPINNAAALSSKSFLHFLTAEEKRIKNKGIVMMTKSYEGLELKFDLTVNKDAEIEVILDKNSGHGMRGRGEGKLGLDINTLGKFNMYGDYRIVDGFYNFKYGVINKTFKVKKGSSISWDGDPLRARLNLEATYSANANPSVMLNNQGLNRKVPVEIGIGITGNLLNPEPDFKINFPTLSPVLKSEIETQMGDKTSRERQALSILGTGSFVSNDGLNQSVLAQNNLYETVGNVIGGLFQNSDDKLSVGIDIATADRTIGRETGGSIGFTVSGQINDKISINGKVGVPVGGINQSTLIGNVEVQYRVNEDGTLNLRFFNRENDINYIGEGVGFTQGVGINYEVDFDTFKQLLRKVFNKQQIEVDRKGADYISDSEILNEPKSKKSKKQKEAEKSKSDAIPPKED